MDNLIWFELITFTRRVSFALVVWLSYFINAVLETIKELLRSLVTHIAFDRYTDTKRTWMTNAVAAFG